jgi:hypothetical protein
MNTGINVFSGSTSGTMSGTVKSNTVRNAGATFSGFGIRVFNNAAGALNVNVSNNTVSNVALDYGILVENAGAAGTGTMQAAVVNNTSNVLTSPPPARSMLSGFRCVTTARFAPASPATYRAAAEQQASPGSRFGRRIPPCSTMKVLLQDCKPTMPRL